MILVLAAALAAPRARAAEAAGFFRDETAAAAMKDAAAEKKIVLLDFTTAYCGPCKRMDLTTWRDPAVAAFLVDRAVAVKVDGDKETKLVARYHVNLYPTMIFVRPDGKEIDRLLNFQSSAQFLAAFKDTLSGGTALKRARAEVAAAEASGDSNGTLKSRLNLADVLAAQGLSAQALAQYLWLFDVGMKKTPAYQGVRASYLPVDIRALGRTYPPALAALQERLDAAERRLRGPAFTDDDARDFTILNWALEETAKGPRLYDSFKAGDPRRAVLGRQLFDEFLKARRYTDAAEASPAPRVDEELAACAKTGWGPKAEKDAEMRRIGREFCIERAAEGIEALAGARDDAAARALLKHARAVDDEPWAREILRRHLERAGRKDLWSGG